MASNDLAPLFFIFKYSGISGQHTHTVPVLPTSQPVVVGSNPDLFTQAGSVTASAFVTAYVALLLPLMYTTNEVQLAELWYKPTPADDPLFINTFVIGLTGTGGASSNPANQLTITYRTTGGGIYKQVLLDVGVLPNTVNTFPFGAGAIKNLSDYTIGVNSPIQGRDGFRVIAPIRALGKVNDALRKRYYNL